MSGPWVLGRNIFWLKLFCETNKSLWGPSSRKKKCYSSTIGGFLAIVPLYVDRECHGFTNPYGLRSRVGTGWHFRTPVKPIPASRVSRVGHGCDVSSAEQLSTTTTTSSPLPLTTTTSRNLRSTTYNHHGTCRRHQLQRNDAATPQQPAEDQLAWCYVAVTTWHINSTFRMCYEVWR